MQDQGTLSPNAPARAPASFKSKLKGAFAVVVLALLPFVALSFLWHDRCKRTQVQSVASPDGSMVAEQVYVDCGERMRPASEVLLRKVKDRQTVESSTVLVLPSREKLPITWNSDHNMAIQLPGSQSQVVKYRREWAGVQIALIGDIISSTPKNIEDF